MCCFVANRSHDYVIQINREIICAFATRIDSKKLFFVVYVIFKDITEKMINLDDGKEELLAEK